jgi:hypothetical protein
MIRTSFLFINLFYKEKIMKKSVFLMLFVFFLACLFSSASADPEREKALIKFVEEKCTKCHDASRVQNIHKLEKSPKEIVNRMQQKAGSDILITEAEQIAAFLEKPSWESLVTECTKCHNLDRVIRACEKGPIPLAAIKRMQEKGANITDEQAEVIHELLNMKARFEKHITLLDLFSEKCTKCHDASNAQKMHEKEKKAMETVLEMQKKEGSAMSDEDVIDITKFLEAPYWLQPLFKSDCTQCHPLDIIVKTCVKDPHTSGIPKETIKMMQKKGAKITDEQVDEIYEILNRK